MGILLCDSSGNIGNGEEEGCGCRLNCLKLCWLVGAAPVLLVLTSWLQRGEQSTLQLSSSEAVQGFFKVFGAKGVLWEYFRGLIGVT